MTVKQKLPSEIYDDWQNTIDSIKTVLFNAQNFDSNSNSSIPSWAINLTIIEVENKIEKLIQENNYQYALNMIASIEGLFNHQLKYYEKNKLRDNHVKELRKTFKRNIKKRETIKFDKILEAWKKCDPRTKDKLGKLKEYLKFRHWLAHGRHWSIHYNNIPDPNEVFLFYNELNRIIVFDLNI